MHTGNVSMIMTINKNEFAFIKAAVVNPIVHDSIPTTAIRRGEKVFASFPDSGDKKDRISG